MQASGRVGTQSVHTAVESSAHESSRDSATSHSSSSAAVFAASASFATSSASFVPADLFAVPGWDHMQQLIRGALRGIKSERATYCRRAALHLLQHADLRQPAAPVGMMYLIWHPGHAQRAGSRECNLQHVGRLRSRRRRRPSGLRIRAWPARARRLRRTRGRSRPAAARCCAVLLPHHLQEPDLAVLRHKRIDFRKLGGVVRCLRAAAFQLRAVQ